MARAIPGLFSCFLNKSLHSKNCGLLFDSNSDRSSWRQRRWPLNRHHGPRRRRRHFWRIWSCFFLSLHESISAIFYLRRRRRRRRRAVSASPISKNKKTRLLESKKESRSFVKHRKQLRLLSLKGFSFNHFITIYSLSFYFFLSLFLSISISIYLFDMGCFLKRGQSQPLYVFFRLFQIRQFKYKLIKV